MGHARGWLPGRCKSREPTGLIGWDWSSRKLQCWPRPVVRQQGGKATGHGISSTIQYGVQICSIRIWFFFSRKSGPAPSLHGSSISHDFKTLTPILLLFHSVLQTLFSVLARRYLPTNQRINPATTRNFNFR